MRNLLVSLSFVALTFLCWGTYGVLMHEGQVHMAGSSLRPFICVGFAYFAIAVVAPLILLSMFGEPGNWTAQGIAWSFLAGSLGALGALGIILAFKSRGLPVYVMPLVFGGAPVVNTLVTSLMSGSYHNMRPPFLIGILLVAVGAGGVMFFKPTATNVVIQESKDGSIEVIQTIRTDNTENTKRWKADHLQHLSTNPDLADAYRLYRRFKRLSFAETLRIIGCVLLTAVCWGSYGPVLHMGQVKMAGSRLRPFLCVGLAYFAIAVMAPLMILSVWQEPGSWNFAGVVWSLVGGAVGAIGALGIIMAFNFGGKPILVMPLVFGCAPIVNTFATIQLERTVGQLSQGFFASLAVVILGAVMVLVFAPKGGDHAPSPGKPKSSADSDDST